MKTSHVLLLGSKSKTRSLILKKARIPFMLVDQNSDEAVCRLGLTLSQIVASIAEDKMNAVMMPTPVQIGSQIAFILTSDTLVEDARGNIFGKPENNADAMRMIRAARDGMKLSTAFCISKKAYKNEGWHEIDRVSEVVCASYTIDLPEHLVEWYVENFPEDLECAGSMAMENGAFPFAKDVHGSYAAIMGLPIFQVRQALEKLGFFD